jgi:hypothetical protein
MSEMKKFLVHVLKMENEVRAILAQMAGRNARASLFFDSDGVPFPSPQPNNLHLGDDARVFKEYVFPSIAPLLTSMGIGFSNLNELYGTSFGVNTPRKAMNDSWPLVIRGLYFSSHAVIQHLMPLFSSKLVEKIGQAHRADVDRLAFAIGPTNTHAFHSMCRATSCIPVQQLRAMLLTNYPTMDYRVLQNAKGELRETPDICRAFISYQLETDGAPVLG